MTKLREEKEESAKREGNLPETRYVMVVGMNRPRLQRVLTLVEEGMGVEQEGSVRTKILPCLAAISSYDDDDGQPVRYMSTFVAMDGSPLTTYLDDEDIRPAIHLLLMVGYEWNHDTDPRHIEGYFQANNLSVPVYCVKPNEEHSSLQEEMQHFKSLSTVEKEAVQSDRSMGPTKMAKFVLDEIEDMQVGELKQEESCSHSSLTPPKQATLVACAAHPSLAKTTWPKITYRIFIPSNAPTFKHNDPPSRVNPSFAARSSWNAWLPMDKMSKESSSAPSVRIRLGIGNGRERSVPVERG